MCQTGVGCGAWIHPVLKDLLLRLEDALHAGRHPSEAIGHLVGEVGQHGERVSVTRTPSNVQQSASDALHCTGTARLNSQHVKTAVTVPATLSSNCKRERSP